jgi:DNA-binding winged helix-turn-helix (wHTH) protein
MPSPTRPFASLAEPLLHDLAEGRCAAVVGMSNSGKSTLMRALASSGCEQDLTRRRGSPVVLVYVDCNQAVASSPQAFYEVVLRAALERLGDHSADEVQAGLRRYHEAVTGAESAFAASLSFNLALTELCELLDRAVVLLVDEFDEIYAALDERALLNMRALKDRFGERLAYVTATVRGLPELRGGAVEGEFAELFSASTYRMPPLGPDEAQKLVDGLERVKLTAARRQTSLRLAGGHPGLLRAVAHALADLPADWGGDSLCALAQEMRPRTECLKIWIQLTPEEQADLTAFVLEQESLPQPQLRRLEALGLLVGGEVFSPVFADYVARRGRGGEIDAEGIHLDGDSGDVWVDGIRIPVLTDLEFRLLSLLYERRDKLTDKYRIVTAVWGEDFLGEIDDARVEKLISRLRGKIESDPANPRYLITQRGRGYKLLSTPRSD